MNLKEPDLLSDRVFVHYGVTNIPSAGKVLLMKSALVAIILSSHLLAVAGDSSSNEYVRFDARLSKVTLAPGARAKIIFTLTPAEGIHINAEPPPAFTLDSMSIATLVGAPSMEKDNRGYLAKDAPLRQSLVIAKNTATGPGSLRGELVYYYCSDTQGWCMRYRQPVELTLTIGR